LVNQKAEMLKSDASTGHATVKAGSIEATYFYDSLKMMSRIETKSPGRIKDLDLLQLIKRTNLDYVGVIRLINEIQLIDRIALIDSITTIGTIGTIANASISINVIKNGSFETGDLTCWIPSSNTVTISTNVIINKYSARIPSGQSIIQYLPGYTGNRFRTSFLLKTENVGELVGFYLFYDDGTSEVTIINATTTITPYLVYGTFAKRLSYMKIIGGTANASIVDEIFSFVSDDTADGAIKNQLFTGATAYDARQIRALTTADGITATLADAENRVLPKAKGKTTIRKNARAINVATTGLHTVSAGTVFYLVGGNLQSGFTGASTGASGYLEVDIAGAGVFTPLIRNEIRTSALIDAGLSSTPLVLAVPMPFAAGTVFQVRNDAANCISSSSVFGWEE
jgi:hypothetical protein